MKNKQTRDYDIHIVRHEQMDVKNKVESDTPTSVVIVANHIVYCIPRLSTASMPNTCHDFLLGTNLLYVYVIHVLRITLQLQRCIQIKELFTYLGMHHAYHIFVKTNT